MPLCDRLIVAQKALDPVCVDRPANVLAPAVPDRLLVVECGVRARVVGVDLRARAYVSLNEGDQLVSVSLCGTTSATMLRDLEPKEKPLRYERSRPGETSGR